VAGSCEYGDEPSSGSGATELASLVSSSDSVLQTAINFTSWSKCSYVFVSYQTICSDALLITGSV
jgi:hypothetical protein